MHRCSSRNPSLEAPLSYRCPMKPRFPRTFQVSVHGDLDSIHDRMEALSLGFIAALSQQFHARILHHQLEAVEKLSMNIEAVRRQMRTLGTTFWPMLLLPFTLSGSQTGSFPFIWTNFNDRFLTTIRLISSFGSNKRTRKTALAKKTNAMLRQKKDRQGSATQYSGAMK